MINPPRATDLGLTLCHICGFTCIGGSNRCSRCGSGVHKRKVDSITRTWALLLGSLIFYIPANLLPVMFTDMFGSHKEKTIMGGVIEFWRGGSWGIALLIFIASVAVPCIKLLVLGTLLLTCQLRSRWAMRERSILYRCVEFIGYWSMLDVLVVALVAALVQFRSLTTIEPRLGILFFGFVVVLTMLSAISFDPRLIWDAEEKMSDPVANFPISPAAPEVRRRRLSVSLVWLVPIVAAVIGLSMVIHASISEGPKVTVSFETAEGLEVNKTPVKYKNVVIGQVTEISLSEDRNRVIATIELDDSAKSFTARDSRFWVVRPRIGAQGISGVDTLLSGTFIGADPGSSKESCAEFIGLETPPPIIHGQHGKRFTLHADDLGSLDIGSPVYYRRINVGQVVSSSLRKDGKGVNIDIFVNAPNDEFVTTNTRFWNASGVDISLGSNGLEVKTQSVSSIVSGGVAFVEPDYIPDQKQASEMAAFDLFKDQQSALAPPDGKPRYIRMRFDQSLRGLAVGSQVEFLGLNLGRVVSLDLDYDPKTHTFATVVSAVIFPDRLGGVNEKLALSVSKGDEDAQEAKIISEFVKNGLRAQARSGNLLTGQLYISLAFIPKAPPVTFNMKARPLEIPTALGSFDKLQEQLPAIFDKIDKLPIDQIAGNLNGSLSEMHKSLATINSKVLPELNGTLVQARTTMSAATSIMSEDSPQLQQIGQAVDEVKRTARSVRVLTDYLGRHPESLIRGRVSESLPDAYRPNNSYSRDNQVETKP